MTKFASNTLQKTRRLLVASIQEISGKLDAAKNAPQDHHELVKQLADLDKAIQAIDNVNPRAFTLSRLAVGVASASAFLALFALLLNTNVYLSQREEKKAEAATAWCTNFHSSGLVRYQAILRKAFVPNSDYWLDKDESGQVMLPGFMKQHPGFNADAANSKLAELAKNNGFLDSDATPLVALIALLNYLDAGSQLAEQGEIDKDVFIKCTKLFAKQYFVRYDKSYVGLAANLNFQQPAMPLADRAFPFAAFLFFGDKSQKAMDEQTVDVALPKEDLTSP